MDDRGETLLELLIAVVIMAVGVVAVVGGLTTSVLVSDMHRKQATANAAVRDYGETVESYVDSAAWSATPDYSPAKVGYTAPSGYTASVLSVACWTGSAWSGCGADTGLQRVDLQVRSNDNRAAEHLMVILRKPCRTTDTLCA